METYEFECGGDRGAWDSLVDVELSDDEVLRLKSYAQDHEYLDEEPPVEDLYQKVYDALLDLCVSGYYEIGEMEDIREQYAEDEDESDEDVVAGVLAAQGFIIRIPYELRDDN